MARFSFQGNPALTDELFAQAMACDEGIHECATANTYCDKNARPIGKYVNYPSWENVHDITDEQVAIAKENYQRRRNECIAGIKRGEIVFVAMGGDYTPKIENGVGNYRMRCDFFNSAGEQFFIELSCCNDAGKEQSFWVDFSIDRRIQKRHNDGLEIRSGYNAKGVEKTQIKMPYTWDNVVKFINKTYGCDYKSARLFRYFVDPDDYFCEC